MEFAAKLAAIFALVLPKNSVRIFIHLPFIAEIIIAATPQKIRNIPICAQTCDAFSPPICNAPFYFARSIPCR